MTLRIKAASDVIARTLGQSAVLIHLGTNRIFELNDTGSRVWDLLSNGATRAELIDALADEFEGDRAGISEAVDQLLDALRAEGLI